MEMLTEKERSADWKPRDIIATIAIILISSIAVFPLFSRISRIPSSLGTDLSNIVCLLVGVLYLTNKYSVTASDMGFEDDSIKSTLLWGLGAGLIVSAVNIYKVYSAGGVDSKYCNEIIVLVHSRMLLGAYFVSSAVVIPVLEELLFRGYFYRILKRRYNNVVLAAAITCALFGLGHLSLSSVLYSLAFTYVYEKSNSLGASICAHILVNASWYMVVYFNCVKS